MRRQLIGLDRLSSYVCPPALTQVRRRSDIAKQYLYRQCLDLRLGALGLDPASCGYDFSVSNRAEWAIEVKGIKPAQGSILFTDREWTEARLRQDNYWLVVVGNMATQPLARIIRNPHATLAASSTYRQSIVVEWRSTVSVNE